MILVSLRPSLCLHTERIERTRDHPREKEGERHELKEGEDGREREAEMERREERRMIRSIPFNRKVLSVQVIDL